MLMYLLLMLLMLLNIPSADTTATAFKSPCLPQFREHTNRYKTSMSTGARLTHLGLHRWQLPQNILRTAHWDWGCVPSSGTFENVTSGGLGLIKTCTIRLAY